MPCLSMVPKILVVYVEGDLLWDEQTKRFKDIIHVCISHRIHVWDIYLHLASFTKDHVFHVLESFIIQNWGPIILIVGLTSRFWV